MSQAILHYIYDPLCGWCYGAAPLLQAASQMTGVRIELHAGGLWMGARRQPMGEALRDYVLPHDERIRSLTGQPFGERYFNGLLLDARFMMDSEPPIRAILAVNALGGEGVRMLHRIQQSHYQDGVSVGDREHLTRLAQEQALDPVAFAQKFDAVPFAQHLSETQQWLRRLGAQGYPTLAWQHGQQARLLGVSPFLGQPQAFVEFLASLQNKV